MRLSTAFQTVIQQTRKVVKRSLRAASRFATEESGVVGVLWRRCVVVFVVFCVTAAITSVSVSAHDSVSGHTPSQQAYEVEVEKTREVPVYGTVYKRVPVTKTREVPVYGMVQKQVPVVKTREVPVYKWVTEDVFRDSIERVAVLRTREVPTYRYITRKKRVAPFSEQYTYQPPCSVLPGYGRYCPPSQTKTRAVFNYRYLPVRIQVGTKTETYTAYEIRPVKEKIGTRKVYKKTGTRTETYTVYETRTVRVQTGTKTETYTAYEKRAVRGKTGTRTQTYTTTETRYRSICPTGHILKNNKCEHPTPPPTTNTNSKPALCPSGEYSPPLSENARIRSNTKRVYLSVDKNNHILRRRTQPVHWVQVDKRPHCFRPAVAKDENSGGVIMKTFIDVGEKIADGAKAAYNEIMKAVCTETGQLLTVTFTGLGASVISGSNVYVGMGAGFIVGKALEHDCSQRRSSYGIHRNDILKAGCTSNGKFLASKVAALSIAYTSLKNPASILYQYAGSWFTGKSLEKGYDTLSKNPNITPTSTPTPVAPFRTVTPTPTPTPTQINTGWPSWAKAGPFTRISECHNSSPNVKRCASDDYGKTYYVYEFKN